MAVQVEGLDELRRALRRMGDGYPKELKEIHRQVGDLVVPDAKRRVNSRSGRLANSIRSSPTQKHARLRAGRAGLDPKTGYDYSRINHYGGYPGGYRGNPFFDDAVDANTGKIVDVFASETQQFVNRVLTQEQL